MKNQAVLGIFFVLVYGVAADINLAQSSPKERSPETIEIPGGSPITVDGKINESEWKDALTSDLSGGGKIRLKHSDGFLLIGLQSTMAGFSHVYLFDGSDVFVLHASAALGMAVYRKEGTVWQPVQRFKWEMRDQKTADRSNEREEYLKHNEWIANVDSTGKVTDREYKISVKFHGKTPLRFAVSYTTNPASPQFFPSILADDSLNRELILGTEPANLNFQLDQWKMLKMGMKAKGM